jgi:hypothetical protein
MRAILARYEFAFDQCTGEEIVHKLAEFKYKDNDISAADKLLGDFRKGFMGFSSLESVPLLPSGGIRCNAKNAIRTLKSKDSKLSVSTSSLKSTHSIDEIENNKGVLSNLNGDIESESIPVAIGRGNYDGW